MISTPVIAVELNPAPSAEVAAQALSILHGLVFLDSSGADHDRGRYSYLMADPFLMFSSRGTRAWLTSKGRVQELAGDFTAHQPAPGFEFLILIKKPKVSAERQKGSSQYCDSDQLPPRREDYNVIRGPLRDIFKSIPP